MTDPRAFQRFVGVDWSGAKSEHEPVPLAIAEAEVEGRATLVEPPRRAGRKWSRAEARALLGERLKPSLPRTLVVIDMSLGLPWGSDRALFGVVGWRALVDAMAAEHGELGAARATAARINARFPDGAPFRVDETRNDARFYLRHHVSYYRQVESLVPQAISAWYVGSGAKVGYHTISGMFTLAHLLARRDAGELSFKVWPHEGLGLPDAGHVIAEGYPAAMGAKRAQGASATRLSADERDALGIVRWLLGRSGEGALLEAFALPELPFGRVEGVGSREQLAFEGWMLGL